MTKLYHREIWMPPIVANLSRRVCPFRRITKHATEAAKTDRYGEIHIPQSITFSGRDVVEAEFDDGRFCKLVVRLPYDATRDAIYAVGIESDGSPFLKTVWFNLNSDKHKTLDRSKYDAK